MCNWHTDSTSTAVCPWNCRHYKSLTRSWCRSCKRFRRHCTDFAPTAAPVKKLQFLKRGKESIHRLWEGLGAEFIPSKQLSLHLTVPMNVCCIQLSVVTLPLDTIECIESVYRCKYAVRWCSQRCSHSVQLTCERYGLSMHQFDSSRRSIRGHKNPVNSCDGMP